MMNTISQDSLIEEQDDILESFDDLLIFPTRQGLRRLMNMIQSYFIVEEEMLKQIKCDEADKVSIAAEQNEIMDMGTSELNSQSHGDSKSCSGSSWIPAPKSIDKGGDKNVAARLARAFSEHAILFNGIMEMT